MFFLKPLFLEETADFRGLDDVLEGARLGLQVATFETKNTIWQGVLLLLGDILLYNLHEVGQRHNRTADHKVVEALFVFST